MVVYDYLIYIYDIYDLRTDGKIIVEFAHFVARLMKFT